MNKRKNTNTISFYDSLMACLSALGLLAGCHFGVPKAEKTITITTPAGQQEHIKLALCHDPKKSHLAKVSQAIEKNASNATQLVNAPAPHTKHLLPLVIVMNQGVIKAKKQRYALLEYLLTHGADPNKKGPFVINGDAYPSLLHAVVATADEDCLRLLLQHGAKVSIKEKDGGTPLKWLEKKQPWKPRSVPKKDPDDEDVTAAAQQATLVYWEIFCEKLLGIDQVKPLDPDFITYLTDLDFNNEALLEKLTARTAKS